MGNLIKNKNFIGLIIVLVLGIIVSIWAFYYLVLPRDVFHWDESHHAIYGLMIHDDIKYSDWDKFWVDTGKQTLWSFLHSWVLGVWFLFFGLSFASARAMSLLPFVGSIILTYLIAIRINREKGWIIGIIASVLMVSSVAILDMATSCMIESLSMFCTLLAVFAFLVALQSGKNYYYFISGILWGIVTLSKYQYGITLGLSLAILAGWEVFEKRQLIKEVFWHYMLMLLGAFPVVAAWFFTPPVQKKIAMLFYAWNVASWQAGAKLPFLQKIFVYPSAILKFFSFSPFVGVFLMAAVLYCFYFFYKKYDIRALLIIFIVPFISYSIIHHQDDRYISNVVPLLYVLFGIMLVDLFMKSKNFFLTHRRWLYIGGVLLFLLLLYDLLQFPQKAFNYVQRPYLVVKEPYSKGYKNNYEDVLKFYYNAIPPKQTVSCGFRSHHLTPYTLWFYFNNKFVYYSFFTMQHPAFFKSKYFLTIEIDKESPYHSNDPKDAYINDLNKWNKFLSRVEAEKKVRLFKEKEFPDIKVKARIFENLLY